MASLLLLFFLPSNSCPLLGNGAASSSVLDREGSIDRFD
jgi:hypothetical protein